MKNGTLKIKNEIYEIKHQILRLVINVLHVSKKKESSNYFVGYEEKKSTYSKFMGSLLRMNICMSVCLRCSNELKEKMIFGGSEKGKHVKSKHRRKRISDKMIKENFKIQE